MKTFLLIITIASASCSTVRAPSLNMLEKRSDYHFNNQFAASLDKINSPLFEPDRTKPQVSDIWIHPHEMPNGDYFRGGWIRTITRSSKWEMRKKGGAFYTPNDDPRKRLSGSRHSGI